MSEEVEIESNITTTEDAFECFQANSMYEEEEFITLSDLVSPPNELAVELPEVVLESSDLGENLPYEQNIVYENIELSEENIVKEYDKNLQQNQNNSPHQCSSLDLDSDLQINESSNRLINNDDLLQQSKTSFNQDNSYKEDISINIQKTIVKSRRGKGRGNRNSGVNKDIDYVPEKSDSGRKRGRGRGRGRARGSGKQHDTVKNTSEPATSSNDAPIEKSSFDALSNSIKYSETTSRKQRSKKDKDIDNANVVSSTISDIYVSDIKPKRGRPRKSLKSISATEKSSDETEVTENYQSNGLMSSPKKKKGQLENSRQTFVSIVNSSEQDASLEVTATSELPADLEHNTTLNKNVINPIAFDAHLQNDIIDSSSIAVAHEEEINLDDDGDDICLSELKTKLDANMESSEINIKNNSHDEETQNSVQSDINTLLTEIATSEPIIENFDCTTLSNKDDQMEIENRVTDPNIIDNSKRPSRRRTKPVLQYDDEGSEEEDPFANVELSDDEPKRKKKGRYCSDDEYVPGKKKDKTDSSSLDSDEQDNEVEDDRKSRKRKFNIFDKNGKIRSPKKRRSKNSNTSNNFNDTLVSEDIDINNIDIEESLTSSVLIKDTKDDITDFLAKKIPGTDIKIFKTKSSDIPHTLFEIPVLDQNEAKKKVETSTQTNSIQIRTAGVQTDSQYDHGMMKQVTLSSLQAEKACEFLKNVVGTTAELGELMTQKSKDFIAKKINTNHVTDTLKMDYCVKKSFLLFKLAKHNLLQMEEDLEKQYEDFLKSNNLLQYRESKKIITPQTTSKEDSDCEIVEVPTTSKPKEKAKFNSKTVFLNKELSIKIAKKSTKTEEPIKHAEKVNVKGRHTVWINDSIMVKKVTQSFLAQDSRNKKPPDYVTYEMVKQFFDNYKKERVLAICRPYTSVEWLSSNQEYVCNYFITDTTDFQNTEIMDNVFSQPETVINGSANNLDIVSNTKATTSEKYITNPKTLLTICIESIQKPFQPKTLLTICIESIQKPFQPKTLLTICIKNIQRPFQPKSLLTICTEIMQKQIRKEKIIKFNEPFENVTSLEKDVGSVKYIYDLDFTTSSTTLVALSLKTINSTHLEVDSLMSLCIKKVNNLINHTEPKQKLIISDKESVQIYKTMSKGKIKCFQAKCLSTLCFKKIQKYFLPHFNETTNSVNSLKHMTMQHINNLFLSKHKNNIQNKKSLYIEENVPNINDSMTMTINCVSTVTDEDFSNIEQLDCLNSPNDDDDDDGDNDNDCSSFVNDNYNSDTEYGEYQHTEESNWVSKVQMQELSLCIWPSSENRNEIQDHNEIDNALSEPCAIQQIKLEPLEVDNINIEEVKTEPADITDEATIPSASILAKQEYIENISENLSDNRPHTAKEGISSFDVDIFESFVSSNKIMKDINSRNMLHNEEIFSQSSQRIRRQYDPDSDEENLNTFDSMGLLIPHSIEQAKDQLMEKSSDDDENQLENISKRKVGRRKLPKKVIKDSSKEKPAIIVNEVTVLTRRMKEKIRREEKRNESSDSDTDIPLQTRVEKQLDKIKSNEKKSEKLMKLQEKVQNSSENENLISVPGGLEKEIQCSDVDSTEFITPDANKPESYNTKLRKSRKDQCIAESINLQEDNSKERRSSSSNLDPKVPAELLECEPDISIENEMISENKKIGRREKTSAKVNKSNQLEFIERNGWKCYNINHSDSKLYDNVSVILEKLPESFVDTYLRFQDISGTNQNDSEVERLTNLNTLHRQSSKDKNCIKAKEKSGVNKNNKVITGDNPNEEHLDNTDHFTELTASEDEDEATEDMSKPECHQNVDNSLAKNLLMDDNDSDSEEVNNSEGNIRIKQEPGIEATKDSETRNGLKCKTKVNKAIDNTDVMLTADIMMNKELTLLHTPVILTKQEEIPVDDKETKTSLTKSSSRSRRKKQRQGTEKGEDDSSSEEEKQWVNTKEKMLKRMEKKQEVTNVDEAKGAKRVSEFIEKRSDGPESRQRPQRGRRRSQKKLLEKRKQMKILAKELFGEMVSGKRSSQAYSKGRRNIRKVIDKKSLARDTVRANMQEFERKQRLSHRQAQLREHLGCEEAVNVVVINDELCLEYDFDKNLPNVSVHPYFTKVMKAHQYEGVKFMWDACFESVEAVSGGRPGGGCILAHCMGLGKTLQVLALLHTVLTNPMLNMRRVLVCCPLSTVLNWVDEIHKWIGPVTNQIKVFELSKLKKTYERAYQLEDWYSGGGIFIIGYELFRNLSTLDPDIDDIRPTIVKKIRTALLDPGPDVVVCDEGHLLKNDSSILAVAMSRVATKRRIVLTGTPMQNNLREYYCMVNFVKPHLLGTYFEYSNRFENPIMNGQHRDSSEEDIKLMKTRTHILHKVLEGCLQRQEASVLYPYLPKKYEYTVFIPLTKCQRDMYTHYLESYASKGKQSVLKDFHTLQKVWTHPQVLHNFQTKARESENKKIKAEKIEDDLAHEDITASEDVKPMQTEVWWLQYLEGGNMLESLESSNKFQVVFKLLDECVALGDKVLIFSTSLYTMDTLEYFLRRINKWSLGQEYYRLDGSVPAEVRQKWCREFNAPHNHKTRLFLISTRAGSLGLNMTAANRVIILDTSWNPAHDIQSIFRVYRFGQKKDCFIYRLVAMGTMEQKIYERSVTKQAVSCRVVDEQQIDRHYNSAELTELYSLDEDGWGLLAGVATGVHDTALLRAAACGALHAVREHDSLLRGSEPALPEHERAAAWQQFQLEHADKHEANKVIAAQQLDQQNAAVDVKPSTSAIESLGSEPSPSPAPGKSKRGKKPAGGQVKTEPPEQPEQPEQQPNQEEDTDKEESLVKKIMQILIAHNFHEPVHLNEITSLIVNVRKLVESGMSEGFTINDPIAANIASVLLQEQRSSAGLPPLTDIANNTSAREDLIISDSTSDVTSVSSDTNTSRRRRFSRRAALKAEQQFDAIVDRDDTSIDGNDTEWDAGDKNKKKNSSKFKQKEKETPPADEMTQINIENVSTGVSTECSILISDDEAVEPPVSTQLEKKKKIKSNAKRNRKRLIDTPSPIEDEPEVPLHTSLLSDENFIKIVAHTYLNGNPMLAEDAALMAAQYSTSKALREYEETGAPIVRGPIYDIAVKVLGKNLLKKMHMNNVSTLSEATKLVNANSTSTTVTVNANVHAPNANVQAPNANVHTPNANVHASNANVHAPNASAQAPVVLDDDDDIQVVKPPIVKMTKPGPKSRRKQLLSPVSDAPVIERPPSPQPEPQNVFPVGMFIGLGEPAQETTHIEECILPDDDDDDIIMKPASQTLPPVSNRALPKIKLSKSLPRIQPIISIDNGAISVPVCENIIVTTPAPVTIPQQIAVVETAVGVNPTNYNKQQPPIESICLSDSDEEPAASASAPARPLLNTIGPSQTTKLPSQTPIIIQSASFKGNSPYVLSPVVKNILDPTKKYYCIPSSSLPPHLQSTNINPPNTIVPDTNSPSVSVQPQSNTLLLQQLLKPSPIAITSQGKVKPIVGTPQNINPPAFEPIQNRTQTRPSSVIEKGFLSNLRAGDLIEIKSSGGVEILKKVPGKKSQPTETVEMKSKLMNSGEVNMPTTSTVNSTPLPTNSRKCASDTNKNDAPTSSNKGGRKSPGPSDDPMSIFKNVIHIQAPTYSDKINKTPIANKTIPDKRPTKSEQTKNVLKSIIQKDYKKKFDLLLNKSNSTKSAIAITKKTTTLSPKKSAISITLDLTGPGSSSDDDKKKRKLELLKRLEKAKWANVSKMSVYDSRGLLTTTDKYRGQSGSSRSNTSTQTSSSRGNTSSQSGSSRSNTSSQSGSSRNDVKTKLITVKDIPSKSKPASSLIDLTQGISILKPKEDTKRPSPWSEPAIKKPKRLQTLEDFDLDDIEDITELE